MYMVRGDHPGKPTRLMRNDQLVNLRANWTGWADEAIVSVKTARADGAGSECAEVRYKTARSRTLCIDPIAKLPVIMKMGVEGGEFVRYEDYMARGQPGVSPFDAPI